MTDFISIYEDAFTHAYCEKFIKYIDDLQDRGLVIQENCPNHDRDHQTINFSNNDLSYDFRGNDELSRIFLPDIKEHVQDYLKKYSVLGAEKILFYDVKAKKIPKGGGFHTWHFENASFHSAARRVVVQLYLNTVEDGGETEFLYQGKRIKAEQGKLLIWPAGFTHVHRGNPPLKESKYILTSWGKLQE